MTRRELALLLCLALALVLIVVGVALWSVPAAWVVAGVGVAALALLAFTEVV